MEKVPRSSDFSSLLKNSCTSRDGRYPFILQATGLYIYIYIAQFAAGFLKTVGNLFDHIQKKVLLSVQVQSGELH